MSGHRVHDEAPRPKFNMLMTERIANLRRRRRKRNDLEMRAETDDGCDNYEEFVRFGSNSESSKKFAFSLSPGYEKRPSGQSKSKLTNRTGVFFPFR